MHSLPYYTMSKSAIIGIILALGFVFLTLGALAFQESVPFIVQFPFSSQYPSELDSPIPRIPQDKIRVYEDRVVIMIDKPIWATFTDTNSMDPVLDAGNYAIEIAPESESEIKAGDIISYLHPHAGLIIHRVVETGYDSHGWYAMTKGENLSQSDPEKVRFDQVHSLVVMIIY